MTWNYQKARWGNHELLVWKEGQRWIYTVNWHSDTAVTTVGRGSANYTELPDARQAAVLHLSTLLKKAKITEALIGTERIGVGAMVSCDQA